MRESHPHSAAGPQLVQATEHTVSSKRTIKILCIGNSDRLLESRCAVLRFAGYEASGVASAQARLKARDQRFELVVLCQTLSSTECDMLRGWLPNDNVLALTALTMPEDLLIGVRRALDEGEHALQG